MTEKEYYEDVKARKEALLAFMMDSVDDLRKAINKKTRIDLDYEIKVRERSNGNKVVEITSTEIVNPIIALAWDSFIISNFGGNFWVKRNKAGYYGSEEDFSKPAPEIGYACDICFDYKHVDGGTNGAKIGEISFTESEPVWNFKLYSEK